ncbi:MAG: hypothetical protein VB087_07955 [Candidatus Limiplasma sp.]|nr:hypothetical protein [Candidatus Limiplasma sp.]MEA5144917.1 hypothetical protein [Candidatus Limiplasma sp.]
MAILPKKKQTIELDGKLYTMRMTYVDAVAAAAALYQRYARYAEEQPTVSGDFTTAEKVQQALDLKAAVDDAKALIPAVIGCTPEELNDGAPVDAELAFEYLRIIVGECAEGQKAVIAGAD